jgi:hypothetical protein
VFILQSEQTQNHFPFKRLQLGAPSIQRSSQTPADPKPVKCEKSCDRERQLCRGDRGVCYSQHYIQQHQHNGLLCSAGLCQFQTWENSLPSCVLIVTAIRSLVTVSWVRLKHTMHAGCNCNRYSGTAHHILPLITDSINTSAPSGLLCVLEALTFKSSAFCPQSVLKCLLLFSEQRVI